MKIILAFIFIFFLIYLDPIMIGPLKWSHVWKFIFLLYALQIFLQNNKNLFFLKYYIVLALALLVTPLLIEYPLESLINTTKYLFFPSFFIVAINKVETIRSLLYILEKASIFVIISFLPFQLGLFPELGKSYELGEIGINASDAVVGIFQQPHSASTILAFSTVSLVFFAMKKELFLSRFILVLLIFLGIWFQLKTYVRLGLLMTIIGFIIAFFYKVNLRSKLKYFTILLLGSLTIFSFILATGSIQSYRMRLLGQTGYNDNTTQEGGLDYNRVSSGRFGIWSSSLENLVVNDSILEIIFGISEPELQKRNKKTINLAIFSHNEFIDMLVINGLLGFLFYLIFLKSWFKSIYFSRVYKENKFLLKYSFTIFIIYLITAFFQGGAIVYESLFISLSVIPTLNNNISSTVL